MDAKQETHLDRDLSSAVRVVWEYLNCDCSSDDCPFSVLVRRVYHEEEEQKREAFDRQEVIMNTKISSDIE